jgi:hypothetical protein
MADLRVNIIATDKASPSINKVGQAVTGLAQQLGALSGGLGRLSSQFGSLIGAGGMAGIGAAIAGLILNIDKLEDEFVDWALGISKVREEYEKLGPLLERHLKQVTAVRNQTALLRLEGSARVTLERAQKEKEVNDLERQIEIRERRRATLQAEVQKLGATTGLVPGAGFIPGLFPRLEASREELKKTEEELGALRNELRLANEQGVQLDETLKIEKSKEGKKNIEELNKALEKLAEENYKNMLQIQEAVDLEQKLFVEWAKDLLEISRDTAKVQAEINELGLARLEKSLGTGVTEEAIEGGLEKQAAKAKKIIEEYREGLARDQAVWLKLQNQREEVIEKQRREWERMLDTVRQGAGQIFDAMLTKGESVFASLANFAKGVLQTMLRSVFQDAVAMLASTSGILRRLLGGGGAGGGGAGGQGGANLQNMIGGGGGITSTITAGAEWLGSGSIGKLVGGGKGGANLQNIITGPGGGKVGGFAGFAGSAAGGALTAGGAIAGQMLVMDAFRRGSAIEGLAGGAMAGASIGTMIAPGVGTAIGAGVGAIAGLITGLFGGGAQRRAEEAAKRAAAQEAQKFAAPETITRFGIAGGAGYSVETDLTGSLRGIGVTPTVIVNVQNNMIDARHAREAGAVIGQEVSRQILQGGSYLGDNIAWAAS